MKKVLFILIASIFLVSCAQKTQNAKSKFIKDYIITIDIDSAIEKIKQNLAPKNYKIVSIFDHEKEALKLKEMLYPTKSINLYNPKISTTLIQCNPTISLEMPIRISLYNELNGKTHIAFTDPEYWSLKHNIKDAKCLNLIMLLKRDLNELTDALGVKE